MIPVFDGMTAGTMDHAITQSQIDILAATGRQFTRAPWIDLSAHSPSLFRFVRCESDQLIPRCVCNGLGEVSILEHTFNVQFLKDENAKTIDQCSAQLVSEVVSPVSDSLMDTSDNRSPVSSLNSSFRRNTEFPLRFGQRLLFLSKESGILNCLSIGKGRKLRQSTVNPGHFIGRRKRNGLDFHGETGVPFAGGRARDRQRFDFAFNQAMQLDLDAANRGQSQLIAFDGKPGLQIGEAVVAKAGTEPRIAGFLSCFDTTKKGGEGVVQPPQHILQDLRVNRVQFGSDHLDLRQLNRLSVVVDRDAASFVGIAPFLQGPVLAVC